MANMTKRRKLAAPSAAASKRRQTTTSSIPLSTASEHASTATTKLLTSTVTSAPPTLSSFFDKLPAEIRILIYELAYPGEEPLKIKATRPVRPRKCVLNRFMVSKQWFYETVPIFASVNEFHFSSFRAVEEILERIPQYLGSAITSISWEARQQLRNFDSKYQYCGGLKMWDTRRLDAPSLSHWLPKLGSLRLYLRAQCWDSLTECTGQEEVTNEFLKLHGLEGLCGLRGLEHFDIMPKILMMKEGFVAIHEARITTRVFDLYGLGIKEDVRSQVTKPKIA